VYIPTAYEESDQEVLHALIRAHPLGAWVTLVDGEIIVNHIPFVLDAARGPRGTLVGHVARANTVWKRFSTAAASVIVFQGAESYISPSWYPRKHAHGKAVPTWNFVTVHARGIPTAIEDEKWLLCHVEQLTEIHEAAQAHPWRVTDAPADYIDKQLQHIVGIEIPIETLQGKWKLSQNRSRPDRQGVIAGLLAKDNPASNEIAELMARHIETDARR